MKKEEEHSLVVGLNREHRNGQWRLIVRGIGDVNSSINRCYCFGCRRPLKTHRGEFRPAHFEHLSPKPSACPMLVSSKEQPIVPPIGTDVDAAPPL